MKKIFVMSLAFLALASCTTQTPDDFTSLYNANVKAEVAKMEDTFKTMYGPQKEITGQISGSVIVDESTLGLTGAVSSNYTAYVGGSPNSLLVFESPKLKVESTGMEGEAEKVSSTTEVSSDKVEILSGLSSLLKFDKIVANATSSDAKTQEKLQKEITDVLKNIEQFNGKWISLQENVNEDALKVLTRISQLTAKDFEKYLTTHQIFSSTGAAVVNGTKRTFNVELDKVQIVNLFDTISSDLGDKKMTEEDKNQILTELQPLTIAGTIAFDTKDPLYSDSHFILSFAEQPQKVKIDATREGEKMNLTIAMLHAEQDKETEAFRVEINSVSKGKNSDFSGKVIVPSSKEGGNEIASFAGKVEDLVLKNFNFEGAFGLGEAKVAYTHKDKLSVMVSSLGKELINIENTYTGEDFVGKVIFQKQEVMNWNVIIKNETLKALTVWIVDFVAIQSGAENPGKLLSIDLKEKEGSEMIGGKAIITTDGQTASADISLEATKKKFGLIVENILMNNEVGIFPLKKFDIFITSNERESSKKIEFPTEVVPFDEFYDATNGSDFNPVEFTLPEASMDMEMPEHTGEVQSSDKVTQ